MQRKTPSTTRPSDRHTFTRWFSRLRRNRRPGVSGNADVGRAAADPLAAGWTAPAATAEGEGEEGSVTETVAVAVAAFTASSDDDDDDDTEVAGAVERAEGRVLEADSMGALPSSPERLDGGRDEEDAAEEAWELELPSEEVADAEDGVVADRSGVEEEEENEEEEEEDTGATGGGERREEGEEEGGEEELAADMC